MKDNKNLVIYNENIFSKIKNWFKNLFKKEMTFEIKQPITPTHKIGENKKKFNEFISFQENKQELNLINKVRQNPEILKQMNMKELENIENAITNRQNYVDKKIAKLKTDIMMKNAN